MTSRQAQQLRWISRRPSLVDVAAGLWGRITAAFKNNIKVVQEVIDTDGGGVREDATWHGEERMSRQDKGKRKSLQVKHNETLLPFFSCKKRLDTLSLTWNFFFFFFWSRTARSRRGHLLHGLEESLPVVLEGHDELELSSSRLHRCWGKTDTKNKKKQNRKTSGSVRLAEKNKHLANSWRGRHLRPAQELWDVNRTFSLNKEKCNSQRPDGQLWALLFFIAWWI